MALISNSQDSAALPKKLMVGGYIKDLQTLSFNKNFKELISGNLIHNRINFKWKPIGKIIAVAELRNRLFWGEEVRSIPNFAQQLKNPNEKLDLQKAWIQNKSLVLHTNVERLNIEYSATQWNIKIGRQRINWSITTTWNSNDIFNTYNFLDFDYEERPGVDGAKFQYLFNDFSNVELAYANTSSRNGNVAAAKFNLNKWGYDMQLISGKYKEHLTIGAGWAGSIKDAGFKGEAQYFFRNKDSAGHFNFSMEGDYIFKNGWYLNFILLFNNNGLYKPVNDWGNINLKLSPENPMPTKWNFMVASSKEITPLLSTNMSILYAPGTNLFILLPSFQYNLATNLDVNLVWQSFFAQLEKSFEAVNHRCYLRLKWSF